jgi:hypothetical protein
VAVEMVMDVAMVMATVAGMDVEKVAAMGKIK